MDAPRYSSSLDLPEIHIQPTDRFRSSNSGRSNSYTSGPSPSRTSFAMSIPKARNPSPPPPLPPPTLVHGDGEETQQTDLGWQWETARSQDGWGRSSLSIAPGSSLYGTFASNGKSLIDDRPDLDRRGSSSSTIKSVSGGQQKLEPFPRSIDEGYSSLAGTNGSQLSKDDPRGRHGFQSSMHDMFQSTTSNYDNFLLKKLDARRSTGDATPPREKKHIFSSSLNEADLKTKRYESSQHLQPMSLPSINTKQELNGSPVSQWSDGSISAISPRTATFGNQAKYDHRPPLDRVESLPYRPSRLSNVKQEENGSNGSRSSRGSYDQAADSDHGYPIEETRRLLIDDRIIRDMYSPNFAAGQKRRASSPPREDTLPPLHTVGSQSDLFRRRESGSRSSPVPRIHSNHGSVSSTASGPRSNSYASTYSLAPSSISTISSTFGRLSPGGLSPGSMSLAGLSPGGFPSGGLSPGSLILPNGLSPRTPDESVDSPYASPRGSVSHPLHQRTISFETRPIIPSRKSSTDVGGHLTHQGAFICECCPKKPKGFDTAEELTAHEQEKQYECLYCKNRFKNKNEAERHQNSLHLRRHSWSCAALTGYAAVFHVSQSRPETADTCGYCGEEFTRTGPLDTERNITMATEKDWEMRAQHLSEVHKFGECNHAKKFFRADHFRQHLKHSHAGTSGKWTNMLENACMKDEPLPIPRSRESIEHS